MKLSLKFTITLAAIAIAALLPIASAATLKGAQDDDIDAKHRELPGNGVFGPPENADPQKPDDAPGKQLDIATNCAGKSALV